MSSVEIRIKGIKSVKGIKTKRGKARRKINRKKQQLAEKKKMDEYSYTVNRPYNYTSPIIPTYITRPEATPQLQYQQQQLDYKPLFDRLAISMGREQTKSSGEQNISAPPPPPPPPSVVLDSEEEIKQALEEEKKKSSIKAQRLQKLRASYESEWYSKKKSMLGFNEWYKKNRKAIIQGENIQIP